MSEDRPFSFGDDDNVGDMSTPPLGGIDPVQRLTVEELHMSMSKSMESIALDVSRFDDSDITSPNRNEDGEDDDENDTENDCNNDGDKNCGEDDRNTDNEIIAGDDNCKDDTAVDTAQLDESSSREEAPDIRTYFSSPVDGASAVDPFSTDVGGGDFFNQLAACGEEKTDIRTESAERLTPSDSDPFPSLTDTDRQTTPTDSEFMREVSPHHIVLEDAVEVALAEEKGDGLKPTPSTKNLTRFFSDDDSCGGSDVAGREFFEAFTAAEEPPPTRSPHISLSESDQHLLPHDTPPISAALQVSPMHRASTSSQPDRDSLPIPDDDPFSAVLSANDVDRRHDAWIASEATRHDLVAMVTGSVQPDASHLTRPRLIVDTPQGDPIYDHVVRFLGEQEARKRLTLSSQSVSQDEAGLKQLIESHCWRAALDLTTLLLSDFGSSQNQPVHYTPYILQLWFVRIALLTKLRMYAEAEAECEPFGNLDNPDLYFEFYADEHSGRRGSMVPFHFRLLHAELPQYVGKAQESLDKLYYLHAVVLKIQDNLVNGLAEDGSLLELNDDSRAASTELWKSREIRLLYSIGNCSLALKDYAMTVSIFESLLEKDAKRQEPLLCGLGRIYVQMGDMTTAEDYFTRASLLLDPSSKLDNSRSTLNKGLLALGYNQFSEAYRLFKQAVEMNPANTVATNNMAVCALYMGKLPDALATLETMVLSDPATFLQEGILFNLCTLYELESSHALRKKEMLLQLVNRHCGNGFNVACLKMA